MKKIIITMFSILVYLGSFSISFGGYNVIDNTNDGIHNSLSATLIQIGSNFLNGVTTGQQAWDQLSSLISAVSGGGASASAHWDANGALHIGCSNNGSLIVFQPTTPPSPPPPPPPPAPVITTSSSTTNGCSSYISHWSTNWSDCSVSGNWSGNSISCIQTPSHTPHSSSCGSQTCTTTYVDGVPSGTSCGGCYGCPGDSPAPSYATETKNISIALNSPSSDCSNVYANNNDTCRVTFNVSAPTNQNKGINSWGSQGVISAITDTSGLGSDRINNVGVALNFSNVSAVSIPSSTSYSFNIHLNGVKSRSPLVTNNGSVSFKLGSTTMNASNIHYEFKKPFIGKIYTWDDSNDSWNGKPNIGTDLKFKVTPISTSSLSLSTLSNYSLDNFLNKISHLGSDITLQTKKIDTTSLNDKNGTSFNARINSSSSATSLNNTPGIQINGPIINYDLDGQNVKYLLSEYDIGNDTSSIKTLGSSFNGVKVFGQIQGTGKQILTGQKANFSDISKASLRDSIRKNAYVFSKNLTSGQEVSKVKFIEGDFYLSGNISYETLIIKNGNLIINGDLNTDNKSFGVIVLKDKYDILSGFNGKGNIYVTPNVKYINAILYADGAFISSNALGIPYTTDSSERSSTLNKQLIVSGTLFTRNTIGGSILAGGKYILPGGSKVDDFDTAMIYDLNYIRRGNKGCSKDATLNCIFNEPFILQYNSNNELHAPILFK